MLETLKPYMLAIKIGVLLVGVLGVFSLGSWAGCSVGKGQSASEISELKIEKGKLEVQVSSLAKDIENSNRQVEANKQFAKERQEMMEEAAKDAAKAKKALAEQRVSYEKKLKDAKKDPDCKAILEQQLCPLLQSY